MNEFYNVLTEYDDVLDGLENSIIAVNLPERQMMALSNGDAADRLRAPEACETLRHKTTFW
ncbi:hypothetical protein [Pantoea sp. KPR_PJ]|uniref:hypothetical protein n=1 Tax=Pantoea sp. KPR_PJ TaxID=2738375 RepID=UPI00352804BF